MSAKAPGSTSGANAANQAIQQNLALRRALLGSAPAMRKNLGNFGNASGGGFLGGTTRIKLFNVGVITRILMDVIATYDVVTSSPTVSPKAPFNMISRVKLTDYDGTDRVNCSGYQLWVWNCVRRRQAYGYNNGSQASVSGMPVISTTVATAQQARFQIEIPVAFDPQNDLRGALLAQTAVGEAWINIDWTPSLLVVGDADTPFNAGSGTFANVSFQVNIFQEYLLPQNVGGQVPLPTLDLMTVYEFAGSVRSSDNIAAGSEKLINYPNVRSVIGCYTNFMNNGVMNPAQTDMTKFRLIANGNNVFREYLPYDKLHEQRVYMVDGTDLRNGTYFELHRTLPIQTALYGNVQYGLTPSTVNGTTNTNIELGFESFYTKGSMLPGLSQSSG